jgi:hypothetical protein
MKRRITSLPQAHARILSRRIEVVCITEARRSDRIAGVELLERALLRYTSAPPVPSQAISSSSSTG